MEEFKNLQETKLTSQPIFDGDVLHIYKDTVRLPNGKTSTREYTVHHGAVCILPLLENGDVLLERQFRYAMGEVLTEIPAAVSVNIRPVISLRHFFEQNHDLYALEEKPISCNFSLTSLCKEEGRYSCADM